MSGKTDEITDVIMAIENIGHELKQSNEDGYVRDVGIATFLEDIAGSLELIASKLGDQ